MTNQVEIIGPNGEIVFHDLDPLRGIANIGRDPENDIVLAGPGIAPFHAVLDYRQYPVQFVILSEVGTPRLNGESIAPNMPVDVHNWGALELDGFSLILLHDQAAVQPHAAAVREMPAASPAAPAAVSRPFTPPAGTDTVLLDESDELIVTEVPVREWVIDVEQTVVCQMTLINGGRIVAGFDIRVQGLDQDWVLVSSPQLSLYEGARATVAISISPPRMPSSRAGEHRFAIVVTSPNYPGHVSRTTARLVINPYYEFGVEELAPKQQSVSWSKQTGQTLFSLTNLGNSRTLFMLEGADDERACNFEFQVPGQLARQSGQVGLHLSPDESLTLPIYITPADRRLVSLRKHKYAFSITASMTGSDQMPRTVMGQLKSAPLLGPWHVLLSTISLLALIIFLFMPNLTPQLRVAPATLDEPGSRVVLTYNASRFAGWNSSHVLNRLNGLFLRVTLRRKSWDDEDWQVFAASGGSDNPLDDFAGQLALAPRSTDAYQLWTRTWIPFLEGESEIVRVYVEPVQPVITMTAQLDQIMSGEMAVIQWQTKYAESLVLEYPGVQQSITPDQLERGLFSVPIDRTTIFTLIATNSSGGAAARKSQTVMVLYPTPVVSQFDVLPRAVTLGENVTLQWEVSGAEEIVIDPLGSGFGIKGSTTDQPPEFRRYRLVAYHTGADGVTRVESEPVIKEVTVNTPTPTPAPPAIQIFDVIPKQVVLGDNQVVNLRWSVTGQTTNVEITAPSLKLGGLDPQDPDGLNVTVEGTTLFILTAYNGERSVSAAVEVSVLEPTPTVTPTPTNTPTNTPTPTPTPTLTPTPYPPPRIVRFEAEGAKVGIGDWSESASGPIYVFPVEAGSVFRLVWSVVNADQVLLLGLGGPRGLDDSQDGLSITANKTYQLVAENNDGQNRVNAFVRMEVYLPPPPPSPFNVNGQTVSAGTTGITITWSYPSSTEIAVSGFRVYRANVHPSTDFVNVAFWPMEPSSLAVVNYAWFDPLPVAELCNKAYYVVAVYQDIISGEERETDASTTSWYSAPCSP